MSTLPVWIKNLIRQCGRFFSLSLECVRRRPLKSAGLLLLSSVIVIVMWRRPHPPVAKCLPNVIPLQHWSHARAKSVGMSDKQLRHFSNWVGGEGIVIRHGYD